LGKLLPGSEIPENLTVSPDSKRVAYGAKRGLKWFNVVDGVKGNEYDDLSGITLFSPDSKHVVYGALRSAWRHSKEWLVVDGVERKERHYDKIDGGNLAFSPNSKRMAFVALRGDMQFVVVDSVEGKEYDGIAEGSLSFTPDSKRVAYWARRAKKGMVVVDGVEGKEYDGLLNGSRLVFDSSGEFHQEEGATGSVTPMYQPDPRRLDRRVREPALFNFC
jgi:hypothetical protein